MTMSEIDPLEADMLRGAVLALRVGAPIGKRRSPKRGRCSGIAASSLDTRGPPAARRELADIGNILEAAIKFVHIERGLSCDLET